MIDDPTEDHRLLASLESRGIRLWLDQGILMIKTIEEHGDPVELNENETDELIEALRRLRRKMGD